MNSIESKFRNRWWLHCAKLFFNYRMSFFWMRAFFPVKLSHIYCDKIKQYQICPLAIYLQWMAHISPLDRCLCFQKSHYLYLISYTLLFNIISYTLQVLMVFVLFVFFFVSPVVLTPLLSSGLALGRVVSTAEVWVLVEHPILPCAHRGLWAQSWEVRTDCACTDDVVHIYRLCKMRNPRRTA